MKPCQHSFCGLWKHVAVAVILFLLLLMQVNGTAQTDKSFQQASFPETDLFNKEMVVRFYALNNHQLHWFAQNDTYNLLRAKLIAILDSATYLGLNKFQYHYNELVANSKRMPEDSTSLQNADKLFTDAALIFAKDVYTGRNITSWIYADEISASCDERDKNSLLQQLASSLNDSTLGNYFSSLEPATNEYRILKNELRIKLKENDTTSIKLLSISLNICRWISHFKMLQSAVINIPSASMQYYQGDSIVLKMKVVVGKPSTPTPFMATWCNQVILYPYWNVPHQIAVNELLPLFKLLPKMVDALNMQVLDKKGNIVDHHKIKWEKYDKTNLPFRFRQSTGCDNPLGVIKFNLTSPYDVYLHDTNLKKSFSSEQRFYSHGCIRLEKPIELARLILNDKLDTTFLQSCIKDQKPVFVNVKVKVPVFTVYMPAAVDMHNNVIYYKDVYEFIH